MSKVVPDLIIDIVTRNPNDLPKHQRNWVKRLQRKLDEKYTAKIVESILEHERVSQTAGVLPFVSMGCAVEEPTCSQCGENTHGEEFGERLANMTDQEKKAISMAGMDIINREREVRRHLPVQQLPDGAVLFPNANPMPIQDFIKEYHRLNPLIPHASIVTAVDEFTDHETIANGSTGNS